jgi:ribosomal protein S18 acetylase RimI-like enzyme
MSNTKHLSVTVRPMTDHDVVPLAEALEFPLYSTRRGWSEALLTFRESFVAELDGRPVGTVAISVREELPGLLHLFALDVSPSLRSRGIGAQLIEFLEAEARRRGYGGVYLEVAATNDRARSLYERLGYARTGEPFTTSRERYDGQGNVIEVLSETYVWMVKRF